MIHLSVHSEPKEVGRIKVNPAHAYDTLDRLMDAYQKQRQLYRHIHRVDAPQTVHRPLRLTVGSVEHARWLFFAAMTDKREDSGRIYAGHKSLWATHADLLYNRRLDMFTRESDIAQLLKKHKIGMADTGARSWIACSGTLFDQLGGDPTRIYHNHRIDDIVALKRRQWNLSGFGPKVLSLLAIFLAEQGMIDIPPDAFPVDVHVQRFALATGILTLKQPERSHTLERILRPLLSEICRERGWAAVEVSHAIWFLGNQLCTTCSVTSQAQTYCPVYERCSGPISTKPYFRKGLWDASKRFPKSGTQTFGLRDTADGLPFSAS